jgi:hypothetical protein
VKSGITPNLKVVDAIIVAKQRRKKSEKQGFTSFFTPKWS